MILTSDMLALVYIFEWKSTEHINEYVFKSRNILKISPTLLEDELPAHHPLRFAQGCDIYQICII